MCSIDWHSPGLAEALSFVCPEVRRFLPNDSLDNAAWFLQTETAVAEMRINLAIAAIPPGATKNFERQDQLWRQNQAKKALDKNPAPLTIFRVWAETHTQAQKQLHRLHDAHEKRALEGSVNKENK